MVTSTYNRIKLDLFKVHNIVHTQTFFAHLSLSICGPIAMRIWPVSYFAAEAEFFNSFFVFMAAVDRRRQMLSEITVDTRKESFAIWNMCSLLYANKDLIKKQVYFNTFFVKNQERKRCALVNILGNNKHNQSFLAQQPPSGPEPPHSWGF